MNLPNKLTMLRVIMIPFFVFVLLAGFIPYHNYIAVGIFIIASLTDMLDGKIARKRNLVTNFGKFMDPLADKLLVCSALICLLGLGRISNYTWLATVAVLIIMAREFIISGFRLVASDNGVVIAASYWGKFKTVTQMIAIILMLVEEDLVVFLPFLHEVTLVIFWIAVTLTVVSLVDYIVKNINVVADAFSKEEKPKKEKKSKKEEAPVIEETVSSASYEAVEAGDAVTSEGDNANE